MAIFSEDFKDKLRDIWDDYDIFIIILGVLIIFLIGCIIICLAHTSAKETRADGGLIIDKFITEGWYYFMVLSDKDGETDYVKVGVKPERYYTTNIGETYNKN